MIIINYPPVNKGNVSGWQARLDLLFVKYSFSADDTLTEPLLIDGVWQVQGISAIATYLDDLERLVAGWYEDRCDKHEFDPDSKS
jgi:hypothetical protein